MFSTFTTSSATCFYKQGATFNTIIYDSERYLTPGYNALALFLLRPSQTVHFFVVLHKIILTVQKYDSSYFIWTSRIELVSEDLINNYIN
ncbi:MAG: hypothetical protein V4668_02900 [Patescibacteria group bacterium]